MTMLSKYHVGLFSHGVPHVFLPLPMFLQQLRHQHLKMLTADTHTNHVQLLPSFRLFSRGRIGPVAHHFDITGVNAMAL